MTCSVIEAAERIGVSRNFILDRLDQFGAIVESSGKPGKDGRAPKRTIRIPVAGVDAWIRRHTLPSRIQGTPVLPPRSHNRRADEVSRLIARARRSA